MTRQRRWVWVTGNHDPVVPLALGGAAVAELAVDGLVLRHAPTGEVGEIVGPPPPQGAPAHQPPPPSLAAASPPTPTACCCRP